MKPNLYCNCTFPIDLPPNVSPFGAKSIRKVYLQNKFGLIYPDSKKIPLYVRGENMDILWFIDFEPKLNAVWLEI